MSNYDDIDRNEVKHMSKESKKDLNADIITGEPGSHPVGTGVGGVGGAAAGAAIGTMAGPLGTLIGVASKANMLDEKGNLPKVKEALFADAVGTTVGAMLGTSTVTTYVESASGVAEGGRTGLTSLTVSGLFLLALFLSPLFLMIPGAATASALILVGSFMLTPILNVDFDDITEAIPAFLTVIMMPLAYSIAEGIAFGMISFVLLKLLSGRYRNVVWMSYVLAVLFLLKFIFA